MAALNPKTSVTQNLPALARKFILGTHHDSTDLPGSKMKLLRGQFALLCMFLGLIYCCVVISRGDFRFIPWHVLLISGGVLAFYLNRKGKYTASTLTLFVLTNSFVYLFTSVDRPQDGMFFYYFITNSLSIILMGYGRLRLIVVLVLLTLALAILSYIYPVYIIPIPKNITREVEHMIFLINLIVSLLFASYVLISVIRENYLAENKLIRNHQELKKINEELDRFVYSASHDMRAPLSSLLGLINVAEKSQSAEEKAMCLNMMRERIGVMEGFLKEITDYARNERSAVKPKSINVLEAINASLDELGFLSERNKISIVTHVDSELTVLTDEPRFIVILNNLISNAIKYYDSSKSQPSITIRASLHQNQFLLAIEDNGIGISHEHIHQIFNMFYRATTAAEGSGLGLYIVNETVQKLGGSISVQSEEGKGSTFTVQLPQ